MCHLLMHTAAVLSSTASQIPRVIQFYELAGAYVESLEELNDQLAKVLIPSGAGVGGSSTGSGFLSMRGGHNQQQAMQERDFWLQFSTDFNAKHFVGGDNLGTVVKSLSAMGRIELMHIFQLLLKLAHFVKLHHDKK